MAKICIVVVTFDRQKSFKRLYASLCRAEYGNDKVDILVSVDGGQRSEGMIEEIGSLEWPYGQSRVSRMPENYGLRRHILNCCQTVEDYDAIILLEDDIVVSKQFYIFARWAIVRYQGNERVAGISLYAPAHNEMADLPFMPESSGSDVYTLQSAQSWGQCWTRSMWAEFATWYSKRGNTLTRAPDMPDRIYSWPESSWKKFAMKYLAESGKTWIYPYHSHSTNYSDVGTHNQQETALYQVQLANAPKQFEAGSLEELHHYDIYFERIDAPLPPRLAGSDGAPLVCDLYATRQWISGPARLLTTRILPAKLAAEFGFAFKPHEANAKIDNPGNVARLYEIPTGEQIDLTNFPKVRAVDYYSNMNWADQLVAGMRGLRSAVFRRLNRWKPAGLNL